MAASPAGSRLDRGTILALVAMALGVFVIANDFTALSVAIPEIEARPRHRRSRPRNG